MNPLTKDIDGNEYICQNVFMFLFWSLWQAYKKRAITYEELKERIIDIDKTISKERVSQSYRYINEVLTKPKVYVIIRNTIRQIISKYCPQSIKEIIKNCNN